MKIITFNVNGIRAREHIIAELINEESPDIIMFQETKAPTDVIEGMANKYGYNAVSNVLGSHHGVGTWVKEDINFEYGPYLIDEDHPARSVTIVVDDVILTNVYVNQGQYLESPEYVQKLKMMESLISHARRHRDNKLVIAGDINICPSDNCVWSTDHWNSETISCTPEERDSFQRMMDEGNLDNTLMIENLIIPGDIMSWYGYKTWRFKTRNDMSEMYTGKYGIRCDHVLHTKQVSVWQSKVLFGYRHAFERPSDHCPILVQYK